MRRLGPVETALWTLDRAVPVNCVVSARVSGGLVASAVPGALAALQGRHPHLRERISASAEGPAFEPCDAAIPLRVLAGPESAWIAEAEREVSEPIATARGPLARCTLIDHGVGGATLLLTILHVVADGLSCLYALEDLVRALAGEALAPCAEEPSVDARLVPEGTRWSAARLRWGLRLHAARLALRKGAPTRLRRDREVSALESRARIAHRLLDQDVAARLAARARAEGATVHGALSAAMVTGVLADARGGRPGRMTFNSAVDLRRKLDPPVGMALGYWVSVVGFDERLRPDAPFWSLARAITSDVRSRFRRGEATAAVRILPLLVAQAGGRHVSPRELARRWERRFPTVLALSNMGAVPIETRHGPLLIESCHGLGNAFGGFMAFATSLHGRIAWNFVWADPTLREEHANALVDDILGRLLRAIE